MRMRLLFVIGAVVLVTGCTSSSGNKAAPKPSATATSAAPIDPARATVLKLGTDLPIVANLPNKIGKENAYFRGFASANVLLGDLAVPEKPTGEMGHVEAQSHPVLYNVKSHAVTRLDNGLVRPKMTQVIGIASTKTAVVWAETPETFVADGDITVYSYRRKSGAVHQVRLDPVPDKEWVFGDDLTVVGSNVYLSMAAFNSKAGRAAIYSGPADGSKPLTILVKNAQRLSVEGNQMTYYASKTKQLVRNLDTGATQPGSVSPYANDKTFCGAVFTATFTMLCHGTSASDLGVDGAVVTITEPSGRATEVGPFTNQPRYQSVVGPWLTFTSNDDGGAPREYLVAMGSNSVKRLAKGSAFGQPYGSSLALLGVYGTHGKLGNQILVHIPSS